VPSASLSSGLCQGFASHDPCCHQWRCPPPEGQERAWRQASEICCTAPMTGFFFRDGCCKHGSRGTSASHTVCVSANGRVSSRVLEGSGQRPLDAHDAVWLPPGSIRATAGASARRGWQEALDAGRAPEVILAATHEAAPRLLRSGRPQKHMRSTFR